MRYNYVLVKVRGRGCAWLTLWSGFALRADGAKGKVVLVSLTRPFPVRYDQQ